MSQENKNYNYFKKNFNKFFSKYKNEYLVISDEEILFHHKDLNLVIDFVKKLEPNTYIIQKCETREENVQMFHTRVTF